MKKLTLSVAFMFVTLFAVSASAQKPVDPVKPKADETKKTESAVLSKWDVVISAPGQDYSGVLKIEKSGDTYKGSVVTELGEAPLANIKIDGDSFSSTISVSAMGQSFDGTMTGKAKDGKIAGEMNLTGLGAIPYAGKKP